MIFQLSLPNGARWRLIETNGVLFAVLKRRELQKRHRTPNDKTSGLIFDTALYPHENKILTRKLEVSEQNEEKERKKYIQSDQPA
jgi:hypothetical protein